MVEIAGIWHVYDFTPEELEFIWHALRHYRLWAAIGGENEKLSRKIEEAIEVYLRD